MLWAAVTLLSKMHAFGRVLPMVWLYSWIFLFTLYCKLILTTHKSFRNPIYI